MRQEMNLLTFFAEKNFEIRTYEVTHPTTGEAHTFTTDVVICGILASEGSERAKITRILQKLDLANGDFHHFFKYLALGLAVRYKS